MGTQSTWGLISRVSSRTYRGKFVNMASKRVIARALSTSQKVDFYSGWKKPFPTPETQSIGITKIQMDNKNNPQGPFCDPFEGSIHESDYVPTKGSGTKDDPFIIPARNECRIMWENVELYGDFRPFKCWWLYAEGDGHTPNNMMRSPFSGRFFKLAYDPTDYYGVDKVDMHSHGYHQY